MTQLSQLAWKRHEAQIRAIASQSSKAAAWTRVEWALTLQDREKHRPIATLSLLPSALGSAAEAAEQAAAGWRAQTALHQEEQPPLSSSLNASPFDHWLDTVKQLMALLERTTARELREVGSQRNQAWGLGVGLSSINNVAKRWWWANWPGRQGQTVALAACQRQPVGSGATSPWYSRSPSTPASRITPIADLMLNGRAPS